MKTSDQIDKILPKLFELKQKLGPVTKGENNPFFKSKYADLNTHLDAVDPLAEALGLFLSQAPMRDERGSYVETRLTDVASSQWVAGDIDLILAKQDMQQLGSAVTYARRYTIGGLLGMKAVDDDGNLAAGKETTKPNYSGYNTTKEGPTTTAKSSFRKSKKSDVVTTAVTEVQSESGGWE